MGNRRIAHIIALCGISIVISLFFYRYFFPAPQLIITPDFGAIVLVGTVLLCLAASMVSFRKVAALDPALVFRG